MNFRIHGWLVLFGLVLGTFNFGTPARSLAVPTLSVGSTSVLVGPSGTAKAVFPVTLSVAPTAAVTVAYATANGTATSGSDYVATTGTLSIPAGALASSIAVTVNGGQTDASGLTFTLTLSSPVNATLATAAGTATILHDTAPVALGVSPNPAKSLAGLPELLTASYYSAAGAANLSGIGLSIGKLSSPATSLYAKYVPSSQLFYLANSSGNYIGGFAAGSANSIVTTLGTLNLAATTVTRSGDQLAIGWDFTPTASLIGAQNVYLSATDSLGLTSGWENEATWTVSNPPSVTIGNTTVLAGPSGTQHAVFTVALNAPALAPISIGFATANGTAVAGTDYTATSGTLNIPVGSATGTIGVPVAGGVVDASGLTFAVTLSSPVNATLGTATGTATIIHDVIPVAVSVSPSSLSTPISVPELLTATYSSIGGASNLSGASLNLGKLAGPSTSLYAKYVASSQLFYLANASGTFIGGYAAGSANTITTTLGTLNLAATTVKQSGNQLIIGWDFTPAANLIGTQNVYLDATDNFGLTSNWENLGTWTVLSPTSASIANTTVLTGASGTTQHAIFNVTLTSPATSAVTLSYATANGTAIAGTDYTATSGTLTIAAGTSGGTISVPVAGGQTDASGLTFTVTLSNPVNSSIGTATATATITHDVTPVAVSVSPNPLTSPPGTAETISATYSSALGASNLSSLGLNLGNLSSPANSIYAKYVVSGGLFYVANASGTNIGGYAAGSANTITTTLGTLNLAATTVTKNGDQIVIGWNFTPGTLTGTQHVYLDASDNLGLTSGWQNLGTWNIFATAPANDDFANAQAISGTTGSVSGTTFDSSFEASEPNTVAGDGSVWFAYTAPTNAPGSVTFTEASGPAITYHVYTGSSLASLTATELGTNSFFFGTSLGQKYYLQIQGPITGSDAFTYNWTWTTQTILSNDDFANAAPLTGTDTELAEPLLPATLEVGEPNPSGINGSVWAAVTEAAGTAVISDNEADAARCINVYTGSSLGTLTHIAGGGDSATFTTVASTVYYVQIGDTGSDTSGFAITLNWTSAADSPPANDDFANAQGISGTTGSVSDTTFNSTFETGEPNTVTGDGSVWFAYTSPSNAPGSVTFTESSGPALTYNVYTGTSLSNLTPVELGTNTFFFITKLSQKYYIQIQGPTTGNPAFTYTWNWTTLVDAFDDFADASVQSGNGAGLAGQLSESTLEVGEPNPDNITGSEWIALTEQTGWASIEDGVIDPNQFINVYTGTALTNLTHITGGTGGVSFPTVAGTTYYIQVGDAGTDTTGFNLVVSWSASSPPPNDDFANAQVISGTSGSVAGTTVGGSIEPGDPAEAPGVETSVWYQYTAPVGTPTSLQLSLTDQDHQIVDVYTGSSLTTLTEVATGNNGASFVPTSGTTYYIEVTGNDAFWSSYTLNWIWAGTVTSAYPSSGAETFGVEPARKVSGHAA